MNRLGRERSSIIELGILFIPSIPALLWLWPNIHDENLRCIIQSAAYLYVLVGVGVIGLRRWSWDKLGINLRGLSLSLLCGAVLIVLRVVAQSAFRLPMEFLPFQLWPFLANVVFYFCLVGFVEELLFRGLLFRALEDWRGPLSAVIGSSIAFAVWHIGWAGPLIIGHFIIGLMFGLIRYRSGSIIGLIIIHGLDDLLAVETADPITPAQILHVFSNREIVASYILLGDILFFAVFIFLIFIYPRLRAKRENTSK
jgi:membrane protease YdiL (CAAX protease family)